ncbi:MAG: peroxiredoxin [Gemmobacter sp.]|jgi:peroxiredoxin|nr:peroxiredoxin [Gemmobacter sp.]
MPISVGQSLPEAQLLRMGAKGPEQVSVADLARGRKLVIFGLPGAFTGTCTTAHVPSFMRTRGGFGAKGVDEIVCISVNDPFVMKAWGEATSGTAAGISFLGDAEGAFTRALGLDFSLPAVGLIGRSKRYALYAEDGVVQVLHLEESPGTCEISGGEALLAAI